MRARWFVAAAAVPTVLALGSTLLAQEAGAPIEGADVVHVRVAAGDTSAANVSRRLCGDTSIADQVTDMNRDGLPWVIGELLHVPASCGVAPPTTVAASTTTAAPATTTSSSTTTTAAPATSTTSATTTSVPAGSAGTVTETFSGSLDGWTFAAETHTAIDEGGTSSASIVGGELQIIGADQNYGEATIRAPRRYDLSGGGTVSLDIADDGDGNPLVGFAYVMFSAEPADAAAQTSYWSYTPRSAWPGNGAITVELRNNCHAYDPPPNWQYWAPPVAVAYGPTDRVVHDGTCLARPDGHYEMVYTPGRLELRNGAGDLVIAYPVTLPAQGYVTLGVHNHASIKYDGAPAVVGTFDNLTYPTSSGGAPSTTTAPTTTAAPTTTVAPTSTTSSPPSSTSTSTTSPPTTTPASGASFFEDFTSATALDRFDWQLHSSGSDGFRGQLFATDHAEHDMACNGPTTYRSIPRQTSAERDFVELDPDTSPLIYHCAPGNDAAKGHVMTVVNTDAVVILSFSPKQTFTNVRRVCFDVNTNNDIGAGKWVNAWIVPTSSVAANGGRFDFADVEGLDPEQGVPGPDDFHFKYFDGSLVGPNDFFWWAWNVRATESASRWTQCVEQTAPNQLTYTRDLPASLPTSGTSPRVTETRTGVGNLPDGPVRVIFQDGSYNPDKHGGEGAITWHWDNVLVDVD